MVSCTGKYKVGYYDLGDLEHVLETGICDLEKHKINEYTPSFYKVHSMNNANNIRHYEDPDFSNNLASLFLMANAEDVPLEIISKYKRLSWKRPDDDIFVIAPSQSAVCRKLRGGTLFNPALTSLFGAFISQP